VLVAGSAPPDGRPGLLLELSCGQTTYDLDGSALVLTSRGPRDGADHPGAPHPEIRLQWRDGALLGETLADVANLERYCQHGQYYDLDA
jgi:hypothetical protein